MTKKKTKVSKKKKKKKTLKSKNRNTGINKDKYRHLRMKVQDRFGTEEGNSKKIKFIDNPNEVKMSAVILKLAEPYLKMFAGNETQVSTIISVTTTVWNMGFLSEEEQDEFVEKWVDETLPQEYDAQGAAEMLRMFNDLKERKEKLFPNIRLVILGHDLRMDKNNIYLDISSAPSKKKDGIRQPPKR